MLNYFRAHRGKTWKKRRRTPSRVLTIEPLEDRQLLAILIEGILSSATGPSGWIISARTPSSSDFKLPEPGAPDAGFPVEMEVTAGEGDPSGSAEASINGSFLGNSITVTLAAMAQLVPGSASQEQNPNYRSVGDARVGVSVNTTEEGMGIRATVAGSQTGEFGFFLMAAFGSQGYNEVRTEGPGSISGVVEWTGLGGLGFSFSTQANIQPANGIDIPSANGSVTITFEEFPLPGGNGEVLVNGFTHLEDDPSKVILNYEISTDLSDPFFVGFFDSDDDTFDPSDDEEVGDDFEVSPDRIEESNGALELLGESPEDALLEGSHTLVLDLAQLAASGDGTASALEEALLDSEVEIILAVADAEADFDEDDDAIQFQGFYQRDESQRAVVRTGFGTDDEVTVGPGSVKLSFDGNEETLSDAEDVLVVTSNGDDFVFVDSAFEKNVIVIAGDGDDLVVGGAGDDEIHGGAGEDVLLGEGFGPTFIGPQLKSFLDTLRDKKITLASIQFGPFGNGSDKIFGDEDFDVLMGGAGSDELDSGDGDSIIFGDAFVVTSDLNLDFSNLFNSPGFENVTELLGNGLTFETSVGLPGDGGNTNTIMGGGGFDLMFGSKGNDDVTGGGGEVDVVFGFAGVDTIEAGDTDSLIAFGGDGNDTITGGSSSNLLLGGEHDDMITGGNDIDVLIGDGFDVGLNEEDSLAKFWADLFKAKLSFQATLLQPTGFGADTLIGLDGFDVLIGGDNSDKLEGGEGDGLLFGDTFEITAGPSVNFGPDAFFKPAQTEEEKQNKSKSVWGKFLELIGTPTITLKGLGDDEITGGSGFDVIVGGEGNDKGDGGAGGSFTDLLIGNEGNDELKAHETFFSIILGGAGDDVLEAATIDGSLGSIQFGDGFKFLGVPANPVSVFTFEFNEFLLPVKVGIQTGLVEDGDGDDTLVGAQGGFNLMIGGDGDDNVTGRGFLDFMLGDSLNLGVELGIDFSNVSLDQSIDENIIAVETTYKLPGLAGSGNDKITNEGDSIAIAIGGAGADEIEGGFVPLDLLFGNEGDDTINGHGGFNLIVGGEGDDTLTGGDDGNFILGDTYGFQAGLPINLDAIKQGKAIPEEGIGIQAVGEGDDIIVGGDGLDVLFGGDGDDSISGRNGFNVVMGDAFQVFGEFDFASKFGAAVLSILQQNPNPLLNELVNSFVFVGDGDDIYIGGEDSDIVYGGDGDDVISGGGSGLLSFDFLVGGPGNDTLDGQAGIDFVFGGLGDDELEGGEGDDHLESEEGEDVFHGGPGNDRIFGGDDNDELFGEEGDDELHGEGGDDLLEGGPGNDELLGGDGDDTLIGGAGEDSLLGGPGNNVLIHFQVFDFEVPVGDRLDRDLGLKLLNPYYLN